MPRKLGRPTLQFQSLADSDCPIRRGFRRMGTTNAGKMWELQSQSPEITRGCKSTRRRSPNSFYDRPAIGFVNLDRSQNSLTSRRHCQRNTRSFDYAGRFASANRPTSLRMTELRRADEGVRRSMLLASL